MDADFLIGWPGVYLAIALFFILCIFLGVRIVPQSEKHVVERFGRLRAVLGPGINFVVPFLDRIAHKVSVLERQLPNASQDAITSASGEPAAADCTASSTGSSSPSSASRARKAAGDFS